MTIYANVVNVRPAGRNVVLEFSSYFGERGQRFPPGGHQPELRVVLSSDHVASLVEILQQQTEPAPLAPPPSSRVN